MVVNCCGVEFQSLYLSLKAKIVVLSSIKREFRQFHVVVVQGSQRSVQKSVIHMESFLLRWSVFT